MKLTNTIKHAWVGLIAGFLLGIGYSWTEGISPYAWAIGWGLVFFIGTIGFEWLQRHRSNLSWDEYMAYKRVDTLVDLIVGNVCFLLPLVVLTFGVYMGDTLRYPQ